jgi:hypothetical protein
MNRFRLFLCGLVVLLVFGAGATARAQAPSEAQSPQQAYDLRWYTVDGGGYTWSSGGTYTLGGTVGQPDAGNQAGGNYWLGGGFWDGALGAGGIYRVYLPLVLRTYAP